jgi:hypothetical protein
MDRTISKVAPWWLALTLVGGCDSDKANTGAEDTGGADGADDGTTTFGDPTTPGSAGVSNTSNASASAGATDGGDDDGMVEDDTAGDGGFIEQPDGGVTGQCSPSDQDCPRGEKCTSFVSTPGGETVDATKCVPETGNAVAGESCTREAENDDCAAGFFCMTDVSGHTGMGFCLEYCDTDVGTCEFGGNCFGFNDGALPVCQVTCDPILQDCSPGLGCFAAFDNFVCAQPGFPEGGGGDGDPCATIQGCQPGLVCSSITEDCQATSCCSPICELSGGGAECENAAEMCIQALDNPPPSLQDVGVCGVPQ